MLINDFDSLPIGAPVYAYWDGVRLLGQKTSDRVIHWEDDNSDETINPDDTRQLRYILPGE